MALSFSDRAAHIIQSEIRAMSIECEKMNGINLAQGVCDTEVPLPVRQGAQRAIEEGINSYTRYDGLPELRQAIARKMKDYNGITADPETQIVVSAGSVRPSNRQSFERREENHENHVTTPNGS